MSDVIYFFVLAIKDVLIWSTEINSVQGNLIRCDKNQHR